jgi:hypothetical protein
MNSRNRKIQIDTSGLQEEDSDHALRVYLLKGFFYSLGFLTAGILFVFAPSLGLGDVGTTNVMAHKPVPVDVSVLNYVEDVSFSMDAVYGGSYIVPGDKDNNVMNLRFSTSEDPFRLKEFKLRVDGLDESEYSDLYMISADGQKYRGSELDGNGYGYVKFENLYLKGKFGKDLVFDLHMSVDEDLKFGKRLRFVLDRPEDLNFTVYGDRAYSDLAYPLEGPSVSIIGGGILF